MQLSGRPGASLTLMILLTIAAASPIKGEDRALTIIADRCGACHGVRLDDRCLAGNCRERTHVIRHRPWDLVIPWMESLGCRLTAPDRVELTRYLMERYGKTYPVRWERLDPVPEGWNVVAMRSYRDGLYAGIEGAGSVLRLEDRTWRPVLSTDAYTVYGLIPFRGRLFAGTNQPRGEVWSSADGTNWTRTGVLPSTERGIIALGRFRDALYAGTTRGRIYRSEDGSSWMASGTLVPSAEHGFPNWVRFVVEFQGLLYAGVEGAGVFQSRDGHTWKPLTFRPGSLAGVRAAGTHAGFLYVGTTRDGEIWRTSDGARWERVLANASGGRGYVGSIAFAGGALYAGIDGHVFQSRDGRAWEDVGQLTPFTIEALAEFRDTLYAGTTLPSRAWVYRIAGPRAEETNG